MAVNKVLDKNRNVIIDISEDTVDALHLASGYTAHNRNGQTIVGVLQTEDKPVFTGLAGVYFFDWDGNIIYHYSKEDFLQLEDLPEIPKKISKTPYMTSDVNQMNNNYMMQSQYAYYAYSYIIESMIPDKWSLTKEQIIQNLNDRDIVDVAALYKTPDDATWIVAQNNYYGYSTDYKTIYLHFMQSEPGGVEIDWGDGSPIETSPTAPVWPNSTTSCRIGHTYNWYGSLKTPYIIKVKAVSGYIYFGYCREFNKTGGDYYPLSRNQTSGYDPCCGIAFFGKNIKIGDMYSCPNNWGGFWLAGGYSNIETVGTYRVGSTTEYKIQQYFGFLRPVEIYSAELKENLFDKFRYYYCIYISRLKKLIINNDTPIFDGTYWSQLYDDANLSNSHLILPNGWGGIGISNLNTSIKIDYPKNFMPTKPYAFANQPIDADRVCAYIMANLPITATYCFVNNTALTSLTCPSSGNDYPSYLFSGCNNLKNLVFDSDVTSISDGMFQSCNNLTYVYIPASVESIGNYAFQSSFSQSHSNDILEIEPNLNGRKYGYYWLSNSFMGKIYYNGTADNYLTEIFNGNQITNENGYSEHFYVLDENGTEIYKDRKYVRLIDELPSILEVPDTITSLNLGWLSWNHKIIDIVIPHSITYFNYMPGRHHCYLRNIYYKGTISEWLDIGMRNYDANPMYCAEHLYVLDENGPVILGDDHYSEVTTLTLKTAINPDTGECYTTTQIRGYSGGIHTIIVPNGTERLSDYAIEYNTSITKIQLPNTLKVIGYEACAYNYSLIDITIPAAVESIKNYAFRSCYALCRVVFNSTSTLPTISSESFYECYRIYEIENHSLITITKGEQYWWLTRYLKNIITDAANTKVEYNNDGEVLFVDSSDVYFMGFIGEGEITFSSRINKFDNNWPYIMLDNNITSIVIPDKEAPVWTDKNYWPFWYGYHVKNIHVGTGMKMTSSCNDSYSHYLEHFYWKGQYCYYYRDAQEEQRARGEPVLTWTIGAYGTSQSISTFWYSYPPMTKKIILEASNDMITISNINENTFTECEEIDFSQRPVKLDTYSSNIYSGGNSYPEIAVDKIFKLNCGSNFYSSSNYSVVYNSYHLKKLILCGTGLTALGSMSLLGGTCRGLEEVELPASLTSINGQYMLSRWLAYDDVVRFKFNSTTPPTLTSVIAGVMPKNLIIVVPRGCKSAYQNATNWPDTTYIEFDPTTGEDIIPE